MHTNLGTETVESQQPLMELRIRASSRHEAQHRHLPVIELATGTTIWVGEDHYDDSFEAVNAAQKRLVAGLGQLFRQLD